MTIVFIFNLKSAANWITLLNTCINIKKSKCILGLAFVTIFCRFNTGRTEKVVKNCGLPPFLIRYLGYNKKKDFLSPHPPSENPRRKSVQRNWLLVLSVDHHHCAIQIEEKCFYHLLLEAFFVGQCINRCRSSIIFKLLLMNPLV
jgi:hypothetical protein